MNGHSSPGAADSNVQARSCTRTESLQNVTDRDTSPSKTKDICIAPHSAIIGATCMADELLTKMRDESVQYHHISSLVSNANHSMGLSKLLFWGAAGVGKTTTIRSVVSYLDGECPLEIVNIDDMIRGTADTIKRRLEMSLLSQTTRRKVLVIDHADSISHATQSILKLILDESQYVAMDSGTSLKSTSRASDLLNRIVPTWIVICRNPKNLLPSFRAKLFAYKVQPMTTAQLRSYSKCLLGSNLKPSHMGRIFKIADECAGDLRKCRSQMASLIWQDDDRDILTREHTPTAEVCSCHHLKQMSGEGTTSIQSDTSENKGETRSCPVLDMRHVIPDPVSYICSLDGGLCQSETSILAQSRGDPIEIQSELDSRSPVDIAIEYGSDVAGLDEPPNLWADGHAHYRYIISLKSQKMLQRSKTFFTDRSFMNLNKNQLRHEILHKFSSDAMHHGDTANRRGLLLVYPLKAYATTI